MLFQTYFDSRNLLFLFFQYGIAINLKPLLLAHSATATFTRSTLCCYVFGLIKGMDMYAKALSSFS